MKRLLLDQGIPRSTVRELSDSGIEAVHAADIGLSRATDAEILEYAANENRVVVTLDADFHTILAMSGANDPSVIRIRVQGLNGKDLAALLLHHQPQLRHALHSGAAISITDSKIRVHRLPIAQDAHT